MALPTKEKTWTYAVNSASLTSHSAALYQLKYTLVTLLGSWVVVQSSNSVTAGYSDQWSGASSVVFDTPGSPRVHSWIVLRNPSLTSTIQVCLDAVDDAASSPTAIRIIISPSGSFGAGTIYDCPTASDQIILPLSGGFELVNGVDLSLTPARLHAMISSDGKCTRWAYTVGGVCMHLVAFDVPKNPVAGWTNPWVCLAAIQKYNTGANAEQATYAKLNDAKDLTCTAFSGATCGFYLSSEGWVASSMGEQMTYPDDDTSEWPMCTVGLACPDPPLRGVQKGQLYDMWWGSTLPATGDTYPAALTYQFAHFGNLILPWNGTVPLVT